MSGPTPDLTSLVAEVRELLQRARGLASRQVDALAVLTNFEIGRRIVLHEQDGEERAAYGRQVLKALSSELTAEFGRGHSAENLRLFRQFYLTYQGRLPISQTPSGKSLGEKSKTASRIFAPDLRRKLLEWTGEYTE